MNIDEIIASIASKELHDGEVVNLGFGIPVLLAKFITSNVTLFGENGIIGYKFGNGETNYKMIDGGTNYASRKDGMSFVDSSLAFAMVRAGKLDVSVLGGLQVSERGDLANWYRGEGIGGVGGAVDFATCANRVIIVMTHKDRKGNPKIVKECTLPLTAPTCVDTIVTEMAIIDVVKEGLKLRTVQDGYTVSDVVNSTEARLIL